MLTPFCALLDPSCQNADLFSGEWFLLVGHTDLRIRCVDAPNHLTVVGIAGHDGNFSGFRRIEGFLAEKETEAAVLFNAAVAADAPLIQNWLNLGTEIHLFLTAREK